MPKRSDWGQAFAAARAAQDQAQWSSQLSRDGEKPLFRDPVTHHYLPTMRDAVRNTRRNTASHLGNATGVPVREGQHAKRAARCRLLLAFAALPIRSIGPQRGISQVTREEWAVELP